MVLATQLDIAVPATQLDTRLEKHNVGQPAYKKEAKC